MNAAFFEKTAELYEYAGRFLPSWGGNPCMGCNVCCSSVATLGVSRLEFDYMEEYLRRNGGDVSAVEDFRRYIAAKGKDREILLTCPFFSEKAGGCGIYEARTLSCRTFGCFIRDSLLHLIPDFCNLKKNTVLYNEDTFAFVMPFVPPFYSLIASYDAFLAEKAGEKFKRR